MKNFKKFIMLNMQDAGFMMIQLLKNSKHIKKIEKKMDKMILVWFKKDFDEENILKWPEKGIHLKL